MARLHHDTGRELRGIVRINEEIKTVVATAARVGLMAMNAIFLAKRAGQSALGFGVLSNELRGFALDLQKQMNLLREMTYVSVTTVTALVKEARVTRLLERTRAESGDAGRVAIDACLRAHHDLGASRRHEQIAVLHRRLAQTIADTTQLVELGSVLARSAKIEAAYGGPFAAALMQVSSDFERTIAEIQRSLEQLARRQDADS
jgi:hypothetical protein